MPKLDDILETCLYVTDLSEAERFYSEVLGLPLVSKDDDRHLFYRCGDRMLLLFNPKATAEPAPDPDDAPPHGAHGPGHVAFSIAQDDFNAWRERLAAHNIPIEKELEWGDRGHSIYFRDPSGNSLEVTVPAIWGIQTES